MQAAAKHAIGDDETVVLSGFKGRSHWALIQKGQVQLAEPCEAVRLSAVTRPKLDVITDLEPFTHHKIASYWV